MVLERTLTFVLSYLGKFSVDLRTGLRRHVERDLSYCTMKVVFNDSLWNNLLLYM